ncbi:uncharacterized protein LODBEIA_P51910 [Lodderomyces beijingensis]|uniref:SURP motif domain-containing protein n=1 Tax=Lodderomyces beijingensis TaxID=1775926 RepID=A0ABP0ZW18_9ASCO
MRTKSESLPASSSEIKIPPQEIKDTIDKCVTYILKNGPSFRDRLLKNNRNQHFNFLLDENEYHGYYEWKLANTAAPKDLSQQQQDDEQQQEEAEPSDIAIEQPRELPFLISTFPMLTQYDLDVIKATALYISINGTARIPELIQHQTHLHQHAQFEFLHAHHSLHPLFQTYLRQYNLVHAMYHDQQAPSRVLLSRDVAESKFAVLTRGFDRAQYCKMHKVKVQREADQKRAKWERFASIEWSDFAIVDAVVFDAVDEVRELGVPLSRDELMRRSLASRRQDITLTKAKPAEREGETKGEKKEKGKEEEVATPPPLKGMKIRAAGTTRLKKTATASASATSTLSATGNENKIKCPITGKLVLESQFDSHLKELLRDPSYKQQQENYLRKNFSYESNVTTDQVVENIKRLMKKRNLQESDS